MTENTRSQYKDIKEIPVYNFPAWLGGFFSTGGRMSLEKVIDRKHSYINYYPRLRIGDNSLDRIHNLELLIGGRYHSQGKKYYWRTTNSQHAIDLALIIAPFTPSRSEIILAFENWQNATMDERREIGESMAHNIHQPLSDPQLYTELIQNSDFFTGVLDCRAIFFSDNNTRNYGQKSYSYERMHLNTVNIGLASAIQQTYGGRLEIIPKGIQVNIKGRNCLTRRDQAKWIYPGNILKELGLSSKLKPNVFTSNEPVPLE